MLGTKLPLQAILHYRAFHNSQSPAPPRPLATVVMTACRRAGFDPIAKGSQEVGGAQNSSTILQLRLSHRTAFEDLYPTKLNMHQVCTWPGSISG